MNKSIFIKLLVCSIFLILLSASFCVKPAYALGDVFSSGKGFLEVGNDIKDTINTVELENTSDFIYNTLLAIAIMVAIVVAMVLGIQFMAASADEKAKVKEALMPFVVGCIVVFGAFTIWKIVVKMGNNAENSIKGTSISVTTTSTSAVVPGTTNLAEYKCNYCNKEISGGIPGNVITGGRDWNCPNCGKKIVEKGNITGATK